MSLESRCDGVLQCNDGSDEDNCPTDSSNRTSDGKYAGLESALCIHLSREKLYNNIAQTLGLFIAPIHIKYAFLFSPLENIAYVQIYSTLLHSCNHSFSKSLHD